MATVKRLNTDYTITNKINPNANVTVGTHTFYTDGNVTLGSNGTDQVTIGATSGEPFIVKSRAPATSKGASGDKAGMVAFSSTAIYYCKTDYTTGTADIWNRQIFASTGVW